MNLKSPWPWIIGILIIAVLIAPVWIYIGHFSFEISSDHKRWGEMGSAMGGIYTPIIAFATLLVLAMQLILQRNMLERERIKDLIAERTSDFYQNINKIERILGANETLAKTMQSTGLSNYFGRSKALLKSPEYKEAAKAQYISTPALLDAWTGMYMSFIGLEDSEELLLQQLHKKLTYSAIAALSFPVASALDSYHFAARSTPSNFVYIFNEELNT
tara:strand:- start:7121 stop:7771 length:651 start_codon:yes stop_codon:yes gene_type:complete